MKYRELGKTKCSTGVIGLGCEHLDGKPYSQVEETISAALDVGINTFDVFMPGKEVRENIARALGSRRKDVMIQGHIGSVDIGKQYDISRDMKPVRRYFEDLLRIFGGHIEFGMMFFIDSEDDFKGVFETEFASYVQRLKENGDIGHIGFSSHNPEIAAKAIETGLPEIMMFSVNPAFDMLPSDEYVFDHFDEGFDEHLFRGIDPKRAQLYKVCEKRGIGITVMKAFGAGKLLSKEHSPYAQPLTSSQCIHYALSRPAVSSVLLGCKSRDEILDCVKYFDASDEERDYSKVISGVNNDFAGHCVYCSHCQPCPMEIDIAEVNKYLDIARLDKDNIPPSVISHYKSLRHTGRECIACGKCEDRCPFGVKIIENMREASNFME